MTTDLVLVVIVMWIGAVPLFVVVLGVVARVLASRRRLEPRGPAPLACAEMRRSLRAARFDRRRSPVSDLARRVVIRPVQRR